MDQDSLLGSATTTIKQSTSLKQSENAHIHIIDDRPIQMMAYLSHFKKSYYGSNQRLVVRKGDATKNISSFV